MSDAFPVIDKCSIDPQFHLCLRSSLLSSRGRRHREETFALRRSFGAGELTDFALPLL